MSLKPRRIVLIPGFMLNEMLWHEFETYLPSNCIVHHAAVTEGRTIHDVVQHLITLLPEKFSLIGFSMGGYIARQLAAEFPERVESLVLIASSLREDTPLEAEAKRKSVQSLSPTTFKGLSRHAIARSLHPLNTSNQDMISAIRKWDALWDLKPSSRNHPYPGKVYLLQRYVVQRWLSPVKMMPSVR